MEKILSYIEDTYAPAALFVYGSYADGYPVHATS